MSELTLSLDGGRRQARPAARAALLVLLPIVLLYACGGPQEGAAAGSECFRDADCNKGLVCVERTCSNDVDALVSTVEGPSGEAAAMTGGMTSGTNGAETSTGSATTGSATTGSATTSTGSTVSTGTTSGTGGTGATTTQGAAGAAGSP